MNAKTSNMTVTGGLIVLIPMPPLNVFVNMDSKVMAITALISTNA